MVSFSSLLFTAVSALAYLASSAHGQAIKLNPVINLCQAPGMFAMTFDQGPSIYTGTILDALASRQVKASFHPVVNYLNDPTVVANMQRAASEGHTIGLSMEQAVDLSGMSHDDISATIDSRAQSINAVAGVTPKFLRIWNYRNLSDDQISFILSKGYVITDYNLDSYDYDQQDVLGQYKKVPDLLSPNAKGSIISIQRDYIQTRSIRR
jgi:peptidoglycan/xylan/chitin deacetylase (PgdA/CDA1 family)